MKKALKSPKVVVVLVIVAFVVVFRSAFKKETYEQRKTPTAEAATEKSPQSQTRENNLPEVAIDYSKVGWELAITRDPFSSTPVIDPENNPSKDGIPESSNVSQAASTTPTSEHELTAVWLQENERLAVINDRIVTEGDSLIGNQIIEQILADHVLIRTPEGLRQLEFKPFGRKEKPTLGKTLSATAAGKGNRTSNSGGLLKAVTFK